MKHSKAIMLASAILILSIVGTLGLWVIINQSNNGQNQNPIPVQTIAQKPASYLSKSVTVTGLLSNVPAPNPTRYELSDNNQTIAIDVDWNSNTVLIPQYNATNAIVHGILKEEKWTFPYTGTQTDIYYFQAENVKLAKN